MSDQSMALLVILHSWICAESEAQQRTHMSGIFLYEKHMDPTKNRTHQVLCHILHLMMSMQTKLS